jgi:hypothetical protein
MEFISLLNTVTLFNLIGIGALGIFAVADWYVWRPSQPPLSAASFRRGIRYKDAA